MARKTKLDFYFANHGTITLLTPLNRVARTWVAEHLPPDRMTLGKGVVIEPRYAGYILRGLQDDGLTVGC